jgi:Ca-activated chloride channel family protein
LISFVAVISCVAAAAPGHSPQSPRDPQSIGAPQTPPQEKPKQPPAQEKEEVVRLSSRLVLVPVSVSDSAGRPVADLKAEDFVIQEEGKPQQVVSLGEPGKSPVEIALLFDVSGSVHGQFEFEQQAAVRFLKEVLKENDFVSIFSIGTTPKLVKPRTASANDAVAGVQSIQPIKATTALFDSVAEAALYLGKNADPGGRRVLVVISDGEENDSKRNALADALRELQRNDCLFYSINPSGQTIHLNRVTMKGQNVLESLSVPTGGKAFLPDRIENLGGVFRQIADELRAQYLLGYYSSDERTDGGFRRISVHPARRSDLRVRARQGYYAPKS